MTTEGGAVLDAGAFIALERRQRLMTQLVTSFMRERTALVTSAGVVAQVWRGGARAQAPIAQLLARTAVVDITYSAARVLGRMLGDTRTRDPIDAHIVLLAQQRGWLVITSDPDDLLAIDPELDVQSV